MQLIIYMDDFETTNPLGDRRGVDKINATYFRIGNLGDCYQSVSYITQAIIISNSSITKTYGYKRIFDPLIKDLKIIETEGIKINEELTLKGTISYFVADNLAANSIGGFVESFNVGVQYCRFCSSIPENVQNEFVEKIGHLRNSETHQLNIDDRNRYKKVRINNYKYLKKCLIF